jgi:hypothetical protein
MKPGPSELPPGLYESLITEGLERRLSALCSAHCGGAANAYSRTLARASEMMNEDFKRSKSTLSCGV